MNFGLDWDGTVTAEPTGFANFINDMKTLGHKVYIVTMRFPSECLGDPMIRKWAHGVDGIIPTSRRSKKEVVDELGINIHVWIDDHPQAVHQSAADLWGTPSAEGNVFIIDQATGKTLTAKLDDIEDKGLVEDIAKTQQKLLTLLAR